MTLTVGESARDQLVDGNQVAYERKLNEVELDTEHWAGLNKVKYLENKIRAEGGGFGYTQTEGAKPNEYTIVYGHKNSQDKLLIKKARFHYVASSEGRSWIHCNNADIKRFSLDAVKNYIVNHPASPWEAK
jgi:hypothetical protein